MSRIQLYAELLLHIQSISFFASLDTEHNKSTKASFSTDGETIVLSHEGDTASIRLPMKIDGAVSAPLTLPTTPAKEFSHRFKLTDKSRILLQIDEEFQNVVPWTADSLDESKTISCRQCGNYLVKQSQISNWKNLPNENWAEMMEFWHCHKPSPQHETSHGNVANSKGYGDTSKLRAVPGTGFTDLTTLLISADDLKYEKRLDCTEENSDPRPLLCDNCQYQVGSEDSRASGWRLFKWSISIYSQNVPKVLHSPQRWASAQLLAMIDNQGVRKFIAQCQNEGDGIVLWVFTPDLKFSSSVYSESRSDPTRAMKVFWQEAKASHLLPKNPNTSLEKIEFHKELYDAICSALSDSANVLPLSARKFQDWNVGLLERFNVYDT